MPGFLIGQVAHSAEDRPLLPGLVRQLGEGFSGGDANAGN